MMEQNLHTVWKALVDEAAEDDFVFDVVVANTTTQDWTSFLAYLKSHTVFEYTFGLLHRDLPDEIDKIFFEGDEVKLIKISFGKLVITCHILEITSIDLYVSIEALNDSLKTDDFFRFVQGLGNKVQKPVTVSVEFSKRPIVYSPEHNSFFNYTGRPLEI